MLPSSTKLQERLLEQFRQQRGRGLDFTLHSNDGREFRVHSAVLESASPYLCDLLGDTEEPAVTLPTIGGGELEACIEYMYGAAPRLDGVDTDTLAKAADYLCLDGLVDPILSPTVLSPAGLTDVTKLIETYYRWQHKQDVRAPVYAAMLRSFASLAAQASWLEAPEELVEALLGSSRLVVRSEGVALEALLTWLRAPRDVPPTPETTARLLSLVRMPPLFGAQQAAERDRALSAAVPRRAPAGEDEAQWLRLLFDAIFEATPWEPLGQPRHAALARRLRELGLTDTDERLRAWLRDAGSGQRPSLVAAARAESLFDNAPCLKVRSPSPNPSPSPHHNPSPSYRPNQVTLERAMAARAPAERLGSGRLYAVGGSEGNGNHLSSVERFDPEAGCWEEVANPNPDPSPG